MTAVERPFCDGCGEQFDPDVCWCGDGREYHRNEKHAFVPMGCNCLRNEAKQKLSMREFFAAVVGRPMNRFEEIASDLLNRRNRMRGQRVEFKEKSTIHGVIAGTIIVDDHR